MVVHPATVVMNTSSSYDLINPGPSYLASLPQQTFSEVFREYRSYVFAATVHRDVLDWPISRGDRSELRTGKLSRPDEGHRLSEPLGRFKGVIESSSIPPLPRMAAFLIDGSEPWCWVDDAGSIRLIYKSRSAFYGSDVPNTPLNI